MKYKLLGLSWRLWGFALWVATGMILRGRALTAQGQGEEGMMQFRQGLAAYRTTEAEVGRSYWLTLQAWRA